MRQIVILFLLVACASSCATKKIIAPPSKALISPDKTKSVRLVQADGYDFYEITDVKAGTAIRLPDWCQPIYAMRWSPDSRSIFVVAHEARGRLVEVLHLTDNKWSMYYVKAPEPQSHHSRVVDWSIEPKSLVLVFVITLDRGSQGPPIYEVTFDVDPPTGKISRVRNKRVLSRQEWVAYRSRFEHR